MIGKFFFSGFEKNDVNVLVLFYLWSSLKFYVSVQILFKFVFYAIMLAFWYVLQYLSYIESLFLFFFEFKSFFFSKYLSTTPQYIVFLFYRLK